VRAAGALWLRRLTSATILLFAIAAIEELSSGIPSTGAPDIERALRLSHTATATVLFVVPGVIQLVLDPLVIVAAERFGRPWIVRGGLAVMALTSFVAALAPGPVTLACALSFWGVATGAAASFAEVTLVDLWPDRRARTMARWTLIGVIGDFLAPLLLGALALLGLGGGAWRVAFAVVGGALAIWTIALCLRPFPEPAEPPGEDEPSLWQAVRAALGDRVLIAWLFGMALTSLLDEILVVFASIHVRDTLGASPAEQAVVVGAFVAGGAVGLVILERLLVRHSEHRLMIATGIACTVVFGLWLAAPTVWLSALLLAGVGATAVPLYPLATAKAYDRCPGRSSVVLVASQLFAPFALAVPWLLGRLADHAGTLVALALLAAQPIGFVVLAAATRRTVTDRAVTTGDRGSRDNRTGDAR
jgi:MFS family permease